MDHSVPPGPISSQQQGEMELELLGAAGRKQQLHRSSRSSQLQKEVHGNACELICVFCLERQVVTLTGNTGLCD